MISRIGCHSITHRVNKIEILVVKENCFKIRLNLEIKSISNKAILLNFMKFSIETRSCYSKTMLDKSSV